MSHPDLTDDAQIYDWAYAQGADAYSVGLPIGSNPHDPVSEDVAHDGWLDGWIDTSGKFVDSILNSGDAGC